jgi:hypothetical protein
MDDDDRHQSLRDRIGLTLLRRPSCTLDELMETLTSKGIEASRFVVSTIQRDFIATLHFLERQGMIRKRERLNDQKLRTPERRDRQHNRARNRNRTD